ncbi:hypothetical protein QBC34DRAFT_385111 [Podospora aff. communis PSN243]|uniref:lytic cellulose monooxygenase (C4-dehydrogenating) n=1 Tax=Podospora aff. communis PSN243 TaxID=3040156 RepID=A0AAV9GAG4_9PEZI|nr:hypothetical protein QBC34DRAFT_385111 [Podospora aff. communis PSN243]
MKFSLASLLVYGLAVDAHAIFQSTARIRENLWDSEPPRNNNPVQNVNSQDMVCGAPGTKSGTVINVSAGDRIGGWWGHIIGGKQYANSDGLIASSHKGPVMAYMAKVDNAASAGLNGLRWFKIWHDGFDTNTRTWGVDNMIKNRGWVYFNIPTCLAPGDYLLRVETLALHSAYKTGDAQFYLSCVQIKVKNSGSKIPSETVSFPGAYSSNHPGITISIYGGNGKLDNNGKAYQIPGPARR